MTLSGSISDSVTVISAKCLIADVTVPNSSPTDWYQAYVVGNTGSHGALKMTIGIGTYLASAAGKTSYNGPGTYSSSIDLDIKVAGNDWDVPDNRSPFASGVVNGDEHSGTISGEISNSVGNGLYVNGSWASHDNCERCHPVSGGVNDCPPFP